MFLYSSGAPRYLPSFPTRRSSDLAFPRSGTFLPPAGRWRPRIADRMPGQKLTECAPVPLNRTASFPADVGRRHAPERSCGQRVGGGVVLARGSRLRGTAQAELALGPGSEEGR